MVSSSLHWWPRADRIAQTALSREFNIYFLASVDEIWLYQPEFPSQALTTRPPLIFDVPNTGLGTGGDMIPQRPHTINNIIVDYYGNEEVLLIALDDGDVIAYHTKDIQKELDSGHDPGFGHDFRKEDVRPFFTANVGKSAWGLSMHAAARLIAVSANSHEITVFAAALTTAIPEPPASDSSKR